MHTHMHMRTHPKVRNDAQNGCCNNAVFAQTIFGTSSFRIGLKKSHRSYKQTGLIIV